MTFSFMFSGGRPGTGQSRAEGKDGEDMNYPSVQPAVFLSRPNRFVAQVLLQGEETTVHVKNTGRCRELLLPGASVWLTPGQNPARKTAWDLIAVQKGGLLINLDAAAPNAVFGEYARAGLFLPETEAVRPEVRFGASRFDFQLQAGGRTHFVEVKGVTLEQAGQTFFPDAPTQRGVKHLQELIRARQEGYGAHAVFVIQLAEARAFSPNDRTHPAFGAALRQAAAAGVALHAFCCRITPESLTLDRPVPVLL